MADSLTRGRQGTTRRRGESVAGGGGQLIQELMDLGHLVAVGRPVGGRRSGSSERHDAAGRKKDAKKEEQAAQVPDGTRATTSAALQSAGFALLAQLVEHLHGKEGVNGSSPLEGSAKAPHIGAFAFRTTCPSSNVRWVWSRLWSFRVEEGSERCL